MGYFVGHQALMEGVDSTGQDKGLRVCAAPDPVVLRITYATLMVLEGL